MNIAELNKRITIQSRSTTQDANGEPLDVWSLVAVVWAKIRPLSSKELMAANEAQMETSHEITIRYRAGLTGSMRAVYVDRVFDLGPPINLGERNEFMKFPAVEGLSDG